MSQPPNPPPMSKNYRHYVLVLLTIVYAFNFIDRQILVVLSESIKIDMNLSDSQLGMLTGFAFAVFYVTMGIPIARLADSSNRRNIVTGAITIWSGMTAASGLAQNYIQLLLARIGVGIGEAGGSPPSHSIISDYYPAKERGRAMSFYSMGVYIGVFIGFGLGGLINQHFGWRVALFSVGLPGLLIALLVRYTIREPIRGIADGNTNIQKTSFKETLSALWQLTSFRYFSIAAAMAAFVSYGIGNFLPSFLIRSHGFDSLQVGTSLMLTTGIGGAIGTYMGGYFADKFGAKDIRWYLWVPAIPAVIVPPINIAAMFVGSSDMSLLLIFLATTFGALYLGPTIAITHTLVSPGMRAMASAVLFFILNLIGLGLGPLSVGVASDLLAPTVGSESLRYAIAGVSCIGFVSLGLCLLAAKHLPKDLENSQLSQANANNIPNKEALA